MVGIFIRLSLYRRSHPASSFSLEDSKEKQVLLVDETRETRQRGGMDVQYHGVGVEFEFEFWPVEHPMEPQDEDRPVKCPMPASSVMNDSRMQEERLAESLRKREIPTEVSKGGIVMAMGPSVRAVRKRLTHEDHIIKPPLPPVPTQNITIFEMLQEFDKFES